MLDHRQVVAGNNLGHSNPASRINSSYVGAGDSEFDFWGGRSLYHDQFRDELQCKPDAEGLEHNSPPLWKSRNSTEYESSPLLSPQKRSEAIAQGRRELMEMIRNIPECSYELSLKDIVDDEKTSQKLKEKSTENLILEPKKRTQMKKVESGGISRTPSMDNKIFLINMFFPWSLGLKKKSTSKNCSRVSPRTSFDRSENHQDKELWMKRISEEGDNVTTAKNRSKSNTSRKVEVNSTPGCWPIFHTKKNKSRGHRGCIF